MKEEEFIEHLKVESQKDHFHLNVEAFAQNIGVKVSDYNQTTEADLDTGIISMSKVYLVKTDTPFFMIQKTFHGDHIYPDDYYYAEAYETLGFRIIDYIL